MRTVNVMPNPRRAARRRLVLASRNVAKLRELEALLAPYGLEVVRVDSIDSHQVEESAPTFVENALRKARAAAAASGLPAIADDSGLEVDALGGAPGVRSARYAGTGVTDGDNVRKLLAALSGVPPAQRKARFRCVAVYLARAEDPAPILGEAVWEGCVLEEARGNAGFGYDPVFYDPAQGCSAAELTAERKNHISHRGRAVRALVQRLIPVLT